MRSFTYQRAHSPAEAAASAAQIAGAKKIQQYVTVTKEKIRT